MTIQRLASRPKGLAYALIAFNETVWNLDTQALNDAVPHVLSLVGSRVLVQHIPLIRCFPVRGIIGPSKRSPV